MVVAELRDDRCCSNISNTLEVARNVLHEDVVETKYGVINKKNINLSGKKRVYYLASNNDDNLNFFDVQKKKI